MHNIYDQIRGEGAWALERDANDNREAVMYITREAEIAGLKRDIAAAREESERLEAEIEEAEGEVEELQAETAFEGDDMDTRSPWTRRTSNQESSAKSTSIAAPCFRRGILRGGRRLWRALPRLSPPRRGPAISPMPRQGTRSTFGAQIKAAFLDKARRPFRRLIPCRYGKSKTQVSPAVRF